MYNCETHSNKLTEKIENNVLGKSSVTLLTLKLKYVIFIDW